MTNESSGDHAAKYRARLEKLADQGDVAARRQLGQLDREERVAAYLDAHTIGPDGNALGVGSRGVTKKEDEE